MPSFRNTVTGVVVNTSDEVGSRLGSDWEPVNDKPKGQRKSKKSE